ncbi:N-(5'-phosphoribosyl)anthranilate isomerase [compost metagenome]
MRIRTPIILAGGLHAGNVAEAIRLTQPFSVDVSSGVETNGLKDPVKMQDFVQAVRSCQLAVGDPH